METLTSFFVGKPINIFAVALFVLAGYVLLIRLRIGSRRHPKSLLIVAVTWMFYAVWELLVITVTPDANIRVDLMIIWPVIALITILFTIRAFW